MASTWKWYFVLVLLPQVLWFISHDNNILSANCEGCSFSQVFGGRVSSYGYVGEKKSAVADNCGYNYEREDEVTARLCSCLVESDSNGSEITESDFLNEQGGW